MSTSNGQRVVAFLLALLFLLSSIGAAAFVIWELRREDEVPEFTLDSVNEQTNQANQQEQTVDEQPAQTIENFSGPIEIPTLRYDVLTQGNGAAVQPGDTVTIHYTGALASNGSVFDSSVSRGEPATFPLDNLIAGWQQGIPGMKVGEKRRLYIPSDLGYGAAGAGSSIPPNSDLIFDIELFATRSE